MAKVYKSTIEWAIEFNNAKADAEFEKVFGLAAAFSDVMMDVIEDIPNRVISETDQMVAADKNGGKYIGKMNFTFDAPDGHEFFAEMERLRMVFGIANS
jgi:hypothetical protein